MVDAVDQVLGGDKYVRRLDDAGPVRTRVHQRARPWRHQRCHFDRPIGVTHVKRPHPGVLILR